MERPQGSSRVLHLVLLAVAGLPALTGFAAPQPDPCEEIGSILEAVPHRSLARRSGSLEWIWDGSAAEGCQIDFETTDSSLAGVPAPDLIAAPGTMLFESGWRMIPELIADGAGSGIHVIRRDTVTCLVSWEQPAYLEDDGTFVRSDTLTIVVQCRPEDAGP